jgi:hypothetical protein
MNRSCRTKFKFVNTAYKLTVNMLSSTQTSDLILFRNLRVQNSLRQPFHAYLLVSFTTDELKIRGTKWVDIVVGSFDSQTLHKNQQRVTIPMPRSVDQTLLSNNNTSATIIESKIYQRCTQSACRKRVKHAQLDDQSIATYLNTKSCSRYEPFYERRATKGALRNLPGMA